MRIMAVYFRRFLFGLLVIFFFTVSALAVSKPTDVIGQIVGVKGDKKQELEIILKDGPKRGNKIIVKTDSAATVKSQTYKIGEEVILSSLDNGSYYVVDYVRTTPLYVLAGILILSVLLVSRLRGVASFVGMLMSFLFIFQFILPAISLGNNPLLVACIGSIFLIPLTFYLSHGINLKTTISVLSSLLCFFLATVLVWFFSSWANLSGYVSEDVAFLQVAKDGALNVKDLLLAGMVIGLLGILDDITVAQAAIVIEFKKTGKSLSFGKLYSQAMKIGNDHIASMVNTLILVYSGASLPLFLLFMDKTRPLAHLLSFEVVAQEIIRMLTGSIVLVLAVPITTVIAIWMTRTG